MYSNRKKNKAELLAPAGNLEKMKTALAFGADAVYAGIPDFSLRIRINDFDLKSLKEGIEYAHALHKKFYVTLNIFAHNQHLDKLPEYVKYLKTINPDGLIVSDPGIAQVIRKIWPKAELHLSTQANCTNWQAAKFWHTSGFERVVLGREVDIREIKEIKKRVPKLELETFIHGAMCMAYSGRCFLSKYLTNRSANLGDCIQPCRWKYDTKIQNNEFRIMNSNYYIKPEGREEEFELVQEEHGSYILNSKDMCLIRRIPEMIEVGIDSFKIEGRAKSVYYLAQVVWAYRMAIDNTKDKNYKKISNKLFKELNNKLVHRGYTEGFMFDEGEMAQNLENSHNLSEWEFCGQVVKSEKVKNGKFQNYIRVHNSLKVGDNLEILLPHKDVVKLKLKKILNIETAEEMNEAHGGQNKTVIIEAKEAWSEFGVLRRKIFQTKLV